MLYLHEGVSLATEELKLAFAQKLYQMDLFT